MNPILNVKKSEEDKRDWVFDDICSSKSIPLSCDYRNQLMPVRNQGTQGTCYAQSAACMKEWQERKDYGLEEYLSPQFFYNNRDYWNNNKQDGEDSLEDYGMTGRDVMKILKSSGICLESEYPYGIRNEKAIDIEESIIESAKKHRINSYCRVNSLNSLKESLIKNGPCLIAFPVFNYSEQMWKKNDGDSQQGGHAMTVVGYNDDNEHFIIRNSWGPSWGDKGYCYYKYSDWGSHWECWTTIDLDTYMIPDYDSGNDADSENSSDNEIISDKILNGKYILRSINGLVDGLILTSKNDTINIEQTGDYIWDGSKYKSQFDDDIIISEQQEDESYILTDSYRNMVTAHKKTSCWDFLFN